MKRLLQIYLGEGRAPVDSLRGEQISKLFQTILKFLGFFSGQLKSAKGGHKIQQTSPKNSTRTKNFSGALRFYLRSLQPI